jgi:hypothetical protein
MFYLVRELLNISEAYKFQSSLQISFAGKSYTMNIDSTMQEFISSVRTMSETEFPVPLISLDVRIKYTIKDNSNNKKIGNNYKLLFTPYDCAFIKGHDGDGIINTNFDKPIICNQNSYIHTPVLTLDYLKYDLEKTLTTGELAIQRDFGGKLQKNNMRLQETIKKIKINKETSCNQLVNVNGLDEEFIEKKMIDPNSVMFENLLKKAIDILFNYPNLETSTISSITNSFYFRQSKIENPFFLISDIIKIIFNIKSYKKSNNDYEDEELFKVIKGIHTCNYDTGYSTNLKKFVLPKTGPLIKSLETNFKEGLKPVLGEYYSKYRPPKNKIPTPNSSHNTSRRSSRRVSLASRPKNENHTNTRRSSLASGPKKKQPNSATSMPSLNFPPSNSNLNSPLNFPSNNSNFNSPLNFPPSNSNNNV